MNEDLLIVDTKVERREEGIVLTVTYEDGDKEEFYLSALEARGIVRQLEAQLSAGDPGRG